MISFAQTLTHADGMGNRESCCQVYFNMFLWLAERRPREVLGMYNIHNNLVDHLASVTVGLRVLLRPGVPTRMAHICTTDMNLIGSSYIAILTIVGKAISYVY